MTGLASVHVENPGSLLALTADLRIAARNILDPLERNRSFFSQDALSIIGKKLRISETIRFRDRSRSCKHAGQTLSQNSQDL
jgi:hypothetical protein